MKVTVDIDARDPDAVVRALLDLAGAYIVGDPNPTMSRRNYSLELRSEESEDTKERPCTLQKST